MRPLSALVATCLALTLLAGCASVRNYEVNPKGEDQRIGFRHYAPVFYLVVETGKDNAKSFKVLTLPDVSKERYIKHKPGWGKAEFNFTLTNGVLTTFGQKTDSMGAEALTAIAALATAYGAMLTGEAAVITAVGTGVVEADPAEGDRREYEVKPLVTAAKSLGQAVTALEGSDVPDLHDMLTELRDLAKQLSELSKLTLGADSDVLALLETRRRKAAAISAKLAVVESRLTAYLEQRERVVAIVDAREHVRRAIAEIAKLPGASSQTIYKIVPLDGGGIELLPVELPKLADRSG